MPKLAPHQRGFTLIELVVVIVILGILAAVAAPKFINLNSDARIATLQGVAGTLKSSADMVKLKLISNGNKPTEHIKNFPVAGNLAVTTWGGYPHVGRPGGEPDIIDIIELSDQFITDREWRAVVGATNPNIARISIADAPDPTKCYVEYEEARYVTGDHTGPLLQKYQILTDFSGC
ncbi:prepilin-type N-terminal cleavage/methylation domain-containing protein [uncultured Ferrimonas sp.]|uniref:type II secretion system protein n=1 Tax=uncultured Ferrimonas sp. TaxID=432640 RepID=UPI002616843E|nr:prepilin-type N-terminal cleavage/methylation domain-containing protein [uncultured Ferrimonas sp.]